MEWSFNIHAEFSVELSLLWLGLHSINIDDSPFLVVAIVSVPHNNISVFEVLTTVNIEYLTLLIDEVLSLVFEELPPSRIGSVHLEV